MATLASRLYDGHNRPDGSLLRQIGLRAVRLPFRKHRVVLDGEETELPRTIVCSCQPTPAFRGRTVARYKNSKRCWIEALLGKGKVVLVGSASNLPADVTNRHIIPKVFAPARSKEWTIEAKPIVEVFEKVKNSHRLLFVQNRNCRRPHPAVIRFTRPRTVIDLRAGLRAKACNTLNVRRLWPGECRGFKVLTTAKRLPDATGGGSGDT